jgi:hypothetical protein
MLDALRHAGVSIGETLSRTASKASRMGPKLGVIALGIVAASIGTGVLVRRIKQRIAVHA